MTTIKYNIPDSGAHENSLFTEVLPSWFFLRTCEDEQSQTTPDTSSAGEKTDFGDSELEILLRDVLSPFSERIHTYGCHEWLSRDSVRKRDVPASVQIPRTSAPEH